MTTRSQTFSDKGFTLMELLLAIFIFSIVVSSVYGAYRATFAIVDGAESRLKISNSAAVVLERISDDLTDIVAGAGGYFNGEQQDLLGSRGDKLTFVSTAHLVLTKNAVTSGWTMIEYLVEEDEKNGMLQLLRTETTLLPGLAAADIDQEKHIICRGLQEVRFSYLNENGTLEDEWLSEGEAPSQEIGQPVEPVLPRLVYMELKFADSMDSEGGMIFKTAVALPQPAKNKG
ncbi:MAG: PulJ/GspJ family protein [Desulforhopalus sp.]